MSNSSLDNGKLRLLYFEKFLKFHDYKIDWEVFK